MGSYGVLKPWNKVVTVHDPQDAKEQLGSRYVLGLGDLFRQDDYEVEQQAAQLFFEQTYLGKELRNLIDEVCFRLQGKLGERVLQLRTSFGGGKTHSLFSLYYWACFFQRLQKQQDLVSLAEPPSNTKVILLSGLDLDPKLGIRVDENTICYTLWGWMAWQLGGIETFEKISFHDRERIAPGGALLHEMLSQRPLLLLFDELLLYIEKTKAYQLSDSSFGKQNLLFIQTLTEVVQGSKRAVMVYALQKSKEEAVQDVTLLQTLDQLVNRFDARRQPLQKVELVDVLKHRLFDNLGTKEYRKEIGIQYAKAHLLFAEAFFSELSTAKERQKSADNFGTRVEESFPFHPALLDCMCERWSELPSYQVTRGALLLLERAIEVKKQAKDNAFLFGLESLPFEDASFRQRLFSQLGLSQEFEQILEGEILGRSSIVNMLEVTVQSKENQVGLSFQKQAHHCYSTVFGYSFGGSEQKREGISERELFLACAQPFLPTLTFEVAWRSLWSQSHHLHKKKDAFIFSKRVNLNRQIELSGESLSLFALRHSVHRLYLEKQTTSLKTKLIWWPEGARQIPDFRAVCSLVFLAPEWASLSGEEQAEYLKDLLEQRGKVPRVYRNACIFVLPAQKAWERLLKKTRSILAMEKLLEKEQLLGFSDTEVSELHLRLEQEKKQRTFLLDSLYEQLCIPVFAGKGCESYRFEWIELSTLNLASRGLGQRVEEALLKTFHICFDLVPSKFSRLLPTFEQGVSFSLAELMTFFFCFFDYPRLANRNVLLQSLRQGVENSVFRLYAVKERRFLQLEEITESLWKEAEQYKLQSIDLELEECKDVVETSEPTCAKDAGSILHLNLETDSSKWKALTVLLHKLEKKGAKVHFEIQMEIKTEEPLAKRWRLFQVEDLLDEAEISYQLNTDVEEGDP